MPEPVDLRSDTVTRPTESMRQAMARADVGDDLYGEDPTVRRLEEAFAARVGKEASLFCASGIMANQIAIRVLSRPATAVVAGLSSHVVAYEEGAAALHSGVLVMGIDDTDGTLDPDEVAEIIAGVDHHRPEVSLVCAENTHMPANGAVWPLDRLDALGDLGVPLHLDGARLFNAEVASGIDAARFAQPAVTVMTCMSKGLGAPVGSMLAGPAELIAEARRFRRLLGGAMRQVGVLAAAGLVALDEMVERLADDHARARRLAEGVVERFGDDADLDPTTITTNIVTFRHRDPAALLAHLEAAGVRAGTIAPERVRFVTHLDVDDAGIERALSALADAPLGR